MSDKDPLEEHVFGTDEAVLNPDASEYFTLARQRAARPLPLDRAEPETEVTDTDVIGTDDDQGTED